MKGVQAPSRKPLRVIGNFFKENAGTIATCVVTSATVVCLTSHAPQPPTFIKARSDDTMVNIAVDKIRWFEEEGSSFYVCADQRGCLLSTSYPDKFVVNESEVPKSYKYMKTLATVQVPRLK